jgi:predicted DsbA family dithiol-disulfide isomerase
MSAKVTYYLEVISSWCFWAEPAWAELKRRFADRVEFGWKIALMPVEAYPVSRAQCEWFYRRSGTILRSPFMLNPGWFEPESRPYLAPNLVAEAAKDLGVTDDRVRLELARAALREGRKVGRWDEAVAVAAAAAGLEAARLRERARAPEIEARTRATTAEFHALQVTQRPTFLIENEIGDRVLLSGVVKAPPIAAAIETLLEDAAAYASHAAHFGPPPSS